MAAVPCTLLLKSNDPMHLPVDILLIVCKLIFKYGVKTIQSRNDQILIQLIYTPKGETLKRKMGNLPVSCLRLNIENEEELVKLEEAMKRFRFYVLETGKEEKIAAKLVEQDPGSCQQTCHRIHPRERWIDQGPSKKRKIKILEDRMIKPPKKIALELNEAYEI